MRGSAHGFRLAALIAAFSFAFAFAGVVSAQGRIIEDVRIAAGSGEASITLQFACELRFVADTAMAGGALIEVRVALLDSCAVSGFGDRTADRSVPPGGAGAHLQTVEYDALGSADGVLSLSFDRPVVYTARQGPSLREIEIIVEQSPATSRRPLSPRVVETAVTRDYMINLQSTREPIGAAAIEAAGPADGTNLYVSQIRVDGVLWHRLRIGFFASETEAKAMLASLSARFPRAWIGRAEPAEVAAAREASTGSNATVPTFEETAARETTTARAGAGETRARETRSAGSGAEETSPTLPGATPLAAAAVPETMAAARERLIDGDPGGAIGLYVRLAETPGEHRPEALEFLGLAYERSGESARARETYQRYLQEFPDSAGRVRVAQRLDSLVVAQQVPPAALRGAAAANESRWDFDAGLAQTYRRDDYQADADLPVETTQSALLTDADFSLTRSGQRIDMLARLSFTDYYDLLGETNGGTGDWDRISYAYVDLSERQRQWTLRLGRQTLHTFGVLGRFDGAHFSYGIGADKRVHVMTGYPVESTRAPIDSDRNFTGAAIELIDLIGAWDVSAFVNTQSFEGVSARNAVGVETRYLDERRSVTALLDYDIDFGEVNTLLLLGTLRLHNRMTLSALVDQRRSPILSVRNALIGQSETFGEMQIDWSETELRQLALDRSPQSSTLTLGLAAPLGERLQISVDITSAEVDATPASGGVPAWPGTGQQLFYSTSLVATGLIARSDVNVWNIRIGDLGDYETRLLTWEGRFAIGRRLRISPRVRLGLWQSLVDGRERQTLSPSLRLLFNGRRYRVDLEFGRDEITRTFAGTERDTGSRFVNFGYRASF